MIATALPLTGLQRMDYETPPQGISLIGYIARRMHKTRLLTGMDLPADAQSGEALARFGTYVIAAATSFGPALYQPRFDRPGASILETDPETGAQVTVTQDAGGGQYAFRVEVTVPGIGSITGSEKILGTTVGLRGLGMPAPSSFTFKDAAGTYISSATGVIHSELAPGLGRWKVRGYGELALEDSHGSKGTLLLDRSGQISITIMTPAGSTVERSFNLIKGV